MLRPTPGRLFYLLIGLVIGAVALTVYISVAGLPSFVPTPFSRPVAEQVKVPTVVSGGKLGRVLAANQEASKAGATMRVNSLEVYDDGFSLTYSIRSGLPGEPAPVLQPERFAIVDDRGGNYRLSLTGSSTTIGPGLSSGYLSFTPALSPDARTLTISVPHLLMVSGVSEGGTARVVDGPWQVLVPLR